MIEIISKYFMKIILSICVIIILWGFWFQTIKKGNWNNIFPKQQESKISISPDGRIVPMTRLSEEDLKKPCIKCHKKYQ